MGVAPLNLDQPGSRPRGGVRAFARTLVLQRLGNRPGPGADQRNLLSYLRGKRDTNREPGTEALAEKVLRGRDSST